MAEQELKACPFCGGERLVADGYVRGVKCSDCQGQSHLYRWNTRPIENALTARLTSAEAEVERLRKIAADAFGFLPVVPGDATALVDSNIVPHVIQVADEYAIRSEQLRLSNAEVGRLGAIMLNLVRAMENEIDTRRCRASSLHALNLARKEANTAAARRQQGGTDAR